MTVAAYSCGDDDNDDSVNDAVVYKIISESAHVQDPTKSAAVKGLVRIKQCSKRETGLTFKGS